MRFMLRLIPIVLIVTFCQDRSQDPSLENVDFRDEMRKFVGLIAERAGIVQDGFLIVPQNGQELVTRNGESDGPLMTDYLSDIDGTGREDLFYGYLIDDQPTPNDEKTYMLSFCDLCEQNGVEVLATDYCSTHARMDDSYSQNQSRGYISFAASRRDLDVIPNYPAQPYGVNGNDVTTLGEARNFLYLIDPERFGSKADFLTAHSVTNYDLLIIDFFFKDEPLTAAEISLLKTKQNGGSRLVLCYLSIGEAEDYRYYFQPGWMLNPPSWLGSENPDWEGNYKVQYWSDAWQDIICGQGTSYLSHILNAGFDGAYLDLIDAFEYYEELTE